MPRNSFLSLFPVRPTLISTPENNGTGLTLAPAINLHGVRLLLSNNPLNSVYIHFMFKNGYLRSLAVGGCGIYYEESLPNSYIYCGDNLLPTLLEAIPY
jgi:hypothetical protein